jgi:OPA family glycerol-3-phosphate transporter-like MFS transporter
VAAVFADEREVEGRCNRNKMKIPKSPSSSLVVLCCAVYFTSYLTRKAYEASILAICDETGLARTAAGLGGTALVALYGSGQFVTGWMADRLDPRRIVLSALLLTAACNAAIPFAVATGVVPIIAINVLNGFAQAMFWPPLVKIFATSLPQGRYNGAVFAVNAAANVAVIAVFALVAGCVRFAGWRLSFWLVAGIALAMAAAWWRQCSAGFGSRVTEFASSDSRIPSANSETRTQNPGSAMSFPIVVAALVPIALAIVCIGVMRDGIEAWAPSIVSDLYGLGASSSTASVALLPLFAVVSMAGARALRRALGDEIRAAVALFAIGLCCTAALFTLHGGSLWTGLPLLALLSASMHGANLMLISELPGRFAGSGRVGMLSGLLNACVYVGASSSIYGFAAIHGHFNGWQPVFALWAAVLAVALILCLWSQTRCKAESCLR